MKKNLGAGTIVAAVIGVVIVIGVAAWRMLAPEAPPPDTPEARAAAQQIIEGLKAQAQQQTAGQQSGQTGTAGAPRLPATGTQSTQSR
jgi:hypothetical protein